MLYSFLRDTLLFFGKHWIPLVTISLVFGLTTEAINLSFWAYAGDLPEEAFPQGLLWLSMICQWALSAWSLASVTLYMKRALNQEYLPPVQAIAQGIHWVGPLLALQFMLGLLIALGFMPLYALQLLVGLPITVGILFIAIPVIYVMVKLILASYFLIVGRERIIDSLRLAWNNSNGYGWTLLGGYALLSGVPLLGIQLLAAMVGLNGSETGNTYSVQDALLYLIWTPFASLAIVFGYRVYTDSQQST